MTTKIVALLLVATASVLATSSPVLRFFSDEFSVPANQLNLAEWTTEFWAPANNPSFFGRTQLRNWVNGPGQFVVANGNARLALDTFNPTANVPGDSLYGTHAKTQGDPFQPSATKDVILAVRMQLTSLQRGIVYGVYFYGCGSSCQTDHDELDIELVSNFLQPGSSPLRVQLNRYKQEPLGAGQGPIVNLPAGFDPLAYHDWKIRWSQSRVTYYLDDTELFSASDNHVPVRPMQATMVAWGPDGGWPDAYHVSLQPVSSQANNQTFIALVDRFTVKEISVFSDSVLQPTQTMIRLQHLVELREHIDDLRTREGLAAFQWSDPNPTARSTVVRAQHVVDLRNAIGAVYTARGRSVPVYTDPALGAGAVVKAVHVDQLRSAVIVAE